MTAIDPVSATDGLTAAQVADRVDRGLVNDVPEAPSRTLWEILRANVLTRFNALMATLLAIVLACGAYRDALFGGVIVANSLVGIVQELRAKRILDRLSVLSSPTVYLVRDGEVTEAALQEIVLDDICELRPGAEVCADGEIVMADGLEIDESLLTGEADPIVKQVGDRVLSGSFVVSGSGRQQVTDVGADAYATKLAEQARKFTLSSSELRNSIDRIVTIISIALVPTGIALFLTQYHSEPNVRVALVKATGGLVAMVPEGLVLLVSVAFAVGVVRLAAKRTLVQELPAIETLARVDVLCLDKTGTITEGTMTVREVIAEGDADLLAAAMAAVAWSEPNPNPTQLALREHLGPAPDGWTPSSTVPFSSARKWSSASFDGSAASAAASGTWIVGAAEMVLSDATSNEAVLDRVRSESEQGRRVLVIAHSDAPGIDSSAPDNSTSGNGLPADVTAMGLVTLEDTIRPDAEETLAYFAHEGVILKVISGDSPVTVCAVAARAGLPHADRIVDARTLPDDPDELADAVEAGVVFGRVSPHQKKAMVGALQSRGHTVAMTGDGVNDVLALKDADVGIAMASGSDASMSVAQLVLMDSTFSSLPDVVAEGRKVINNLQRTAGLYLTKTTWALLLAITTSVLRIDYPFLPRQITIVSTGIIGIPSLFLALAPNTERLQGKFLNRVLATAIPCGVAICASVMTVYVIARSHHHLSAEQQSTAAAIVLIFMSVAVLVLSARPLAGWKVGMVATVTGLVLLAVATPPGRRYFELTLPDAAMNEIVVLVTVIGTTVMVAAELWAVGRWRANLDNSANPTG